MDKTVVHPQEFHPVDVNDAVGPLPVEQKELFAGLPDEIVGKMDQVPEFTFGTCRTNVAYDDAFPVLNLVNLDRGGPFGVLDFPDFVHILCFRSAKYKNMDWIWLIVSVLYFHKNDPGQVRKDWDVARLSTIDYKLEVKLVDGLCNNPRLYNDSLFPFQ